MRDSKIPESNPAPAKNNMALKIILALLLVVIVIGMVLRNKKDNTPLSTGTEKRSSDAIPPDSLAH